jgi:Peptide methionine sulfoxide reductase
MAGDHQILVGLDNICGDAAARRANALLVFPIGPLVQLQPQPATSSANRASHRCCILADTGREHILQIYFSVAHDPIELNRQGPDVGTQYRSAIFPTNPEQTRIAEGYIAQLDQAHVFAAAVVTKVESDRDFYSAKRR